jgi:hypothetical protein
MATAILAPLLSGHYLLQRLQRPQNFSQAAFDAMSQEGKLAVIQVEGTFLARRWQEKNELSLYHIRGGFFCELQHNANTLELLRAHTFTDSTLLEDYVINLMMDDLNSKSGVV